MECEFQRHHQKLQSLDLDSAPLRLSEVATPPPRLSSAQNTKQAIENVDGGVKIQAFGIPLLLLAFQNSECAKKKRPRRTTFPNTKNLQDTLWHSTRSANTQWSLYGPRNDARLACDVLEGLAIVFRGLLRNNPRMEFLMPHRARASLCSCGRTQEFGPCGPHKSSCVGMLWSFRFQPTTKP